MEKFYERPNKRLSDIQKGLNFATSAVPEKGDKLILLQSEHGPPNLRKVIGHTVDG